MRNLFFGSVEVVMAAKNGCRGYRTQSVAHSRNSLTLDSKKEEKN